jgi:hypothetical protein
MKRVSKSFPCGICSGVWGPWGRGRIERGKGLNLYSYRFKETGEEGGEEEGGGEGEEGTDEKDRDRVEEGVCVPEVEVAKETEGLDGSGNCWFYSGRDGTGRD